MVEQERNILRQTKKFESEVCNAIMINRRPAALSPQSARRVEGLPRFRCGRHDESKACRAFAAVGTTSRYQSNSDLYRVVAMRGQCKRTITGKFNSTYLTFKTLIIRGLRIARAWCSVMNSGFLDVIVALHWPVQACGAVSANIRCCVKC